MTHPHDRGEVTKSAGYFLMRPNRINAIGAVSPAAWSGNQRLVERMVFIGSVFGRAKRQPQVLLVT